MAGNARRRGTGSAARGGVNLAWIENQRQYFVRKVAQLHRSGMRTKWLKRALFATIVVVVLVLLLLGESAAHALSLAYRSKMP